MSGGGNLLVQNGTGDKGGVTGMFTGPSDEDMAGVLERDDLAAGFEGEGRPAWTGGRE